MMGDTGVTFQRHAQRKMGQRDVSEAQVRTVLRDYHTSYPAEPLPHTSLRVIVYVGTVGDRDLKIYVLEGSSPPHVMTVVWKGDDE
jgi:hypothetical protein